MMSSSKPASQLPLIEAPSSLQTLLTSIDETSKLGNDELNRPPTTTTTTLSTTTTVTILPSSTSNRPASQMRTFSRAAQTADASKKLQEGEWVHVMMKLNEEDKNEQPVSDERGV